MNNSALRIFSKITCFATLLLIFIGGMVTSTGSGLSVPDWPLSYGTLFPPMVGGVFYEHGHRMAAGTVGFLILILAIWLGRCEKRRWTKFLGFAALGTVILQGVLGGITVLFFLPMGVSVFHAVLAQTFFVLTILIAYSQSEERRMREEKEEPSPSEAVKVFLKLNFLFLIVVYCQLIIAALMRHTHSGLAIPDFPTMGGRYWPAFDQAMLDRINEWRFMQNMDLVTINQVVIHFIHRVMAFIILILGVWLFVKGCLTFPADSLVRKTLIFLVTLIVFQITLGIITVLTRKAPTITSLHVMVGAGTLGTSVLLLLRSSPLGWKEFKEKIFN